MALGVLLAALFLTGCSDGRQNFYYNEVDREHIEIEDDLIDIHLIKMQIGSSRMLDGGNRLANVSFSLPSPYATYLITQASIYAERKRELRYHEFAKIFLEQLENYDSINLLDLYYVMLLTGEYSSLLTESAFRNVVVFLETLYCPMVGAYDLFPHGVLEMHRDDIEYLQSTFMVLTIKASLNLEVQNLNTWIERTTQRLQDIVKNLNPEMKVFSGKYIAFLEILRTLDIIPPDGLIERALYQFEASLDSITEIRNVVNLPIYIRDYLELSLLVGHDTSRYHGLILEELTEEGTFVDELLFFPMDPLSFNAAMRVLNVIGHDFIGDLNLQELFLKFEMFKWSHVAFIQPFEAQSQFEETYFVNRIKNILGIEVDSNFEQWLQSLSEDLLYAMPQGVYMYLNLVGISRLQQIDDSIIRRLETNLLENLRYLLDSELPLAVKLQQMLFTVKSLDYLNIKFIDMASELEEVINSIEYSDTNDVINNFVKMTFELRIRNLLGLEDTSGICKLWVLWELLTTDGGYNMVLIHYMALEVINEFELSMPDEKLSLVLEDLSNSLHSSGLFTAGIHLTENRPTFESTYRALSILSMLENNS